MSLSSKIHLRDGEEIQEIIHRYSLTYFWRYLLGLVLMFVTSFFMFWLFAQGWWGYTLYGIGMFMGIFIIFRTWFFSNKNFLVVTSERVVDVNRVGWFDEVVSSVGYADVKDIFFRKKGILASIFNYGSLFIETKSQKTVLEAEKVRAPQKWQTVITDALEQSRRGRRLSNRQAVYAEFIKIIGDLSEAEICEVKDLLENRLEVFNDIEIDSDEVVK